jgi:hypothetical protein
LCAARWLGGVPFALMLKRIHVNQHIIRANRRDNANAPPVTIKTYKANVKGHEVRIDGPSRLVYAPEHPLSCGARLWVETDAPVSVTCDGRTTDFA